MFDKVHDGNFPPNRFAVSSQKDTGSFPKASTPTANDFQRPVSCFKDIAEDRKLIG